MFDEEPKESEGSAAAFPAQSDPDSTSLAPPSLEPVIFYPRWCKRCGLCAAFCARGAVEIGADGYPVLVDPERCNSCGLCEVLCPDFAIDVPARHAKT